MTKDRDFKKAVRARAAKTGESYAGARAHMTGAKASVYTFDSLTADAKRALAGAEELARAAGSDVIRFEHLLKTVMSMQSVWQTRWKRISGQPGQVTTGQLETGPLAPDEGDDEEVPGSTLEAPLPSRQVRRVLEEAFASAGAHKERHVGIPHLIDGLRRVRPRSPIVGMVASADRPAYSPELADLLDRARQRAQRGGMEEVSIEDLLAELGS